MIQGVATLNDCDIASRGTMSKSDTVQDATLAIPTFVISKTKGARDDWTFTFTPNGRSYLYASENF
jgi:hypothetical protein